MKKVIIVTRKLVMGGIEKALIEMTKNMNSENYDITILVMEKGGEFESEIPNGIKIRCMYDNEKSVINKVMESVKSVQLIRTFKLIRNTVKSYFTKNMFKSYDCISKTLTSSDEEYDLAISYTTPISFPVIYVINNIRATKKVMWIHSDIDQFKDSIKGFENYYYKYHYIYSVSKNGLYKFANRFPGCKEKIGVFYNSIYEEDIKELSREKDVFIDRFKGIRIVTVARLSYEKGIDLIIEAMSNLIKDGYNIRWYCIGEGDIRWELESNIYKANLSENILLIGNKKNPYPYIDKCDIYVQPSRYEGYCITLAEARALKKPIVTTNFMGAIEQIVNEETGLIVDVDSEQITLAIKRLIDDKQLKSTLVSNLKNIKIDTRSEIKKLSNI